MFLTKILSKRKKSIDSIVQKGIDQLFDKYSTEFDSAGDMLSRMDWDLSNKEIYNLIAEDLKTIDTTKATKSLVKDSISIARLVNRFVYNSYKYSETQLSAYKIPDGKFVNCMAISQIIHMIWDNLFYTETLAGITSQHFIAILALPNGKFLSLDGAPAILDIKPISGIQYPSNYPWLIVGDNSQFYIGATLTWIASEYRKNKDFRLAGEYYRSALTIFPENPDLHFNYGNLLWETARYEEAYDSYKMSVQLYPKSIVFRDTLRTIEGVMRRTPNKAIKPTIGI